MTMQAEISRGAGGSSAPRLIALLGYARCGKDTVADLLSEAGFQRAAFADPIYNVVTGLNPIVKVEPSAGLRYRLRPHRRLADVVGRHGWDWLKDHSPEGRRLLNAIGAEIRNIDNEFWVSATMGSLSPERSYVVTDCRFPAEAEAIKARGGVLVRITRPGIAAASDPLTGLPYRSEIALDGYAVDYDLTNDRTLDELGQATLRVLGNIRANASA